MPSESDNIYSVIDLGTNTCLLLIASLSGDKISKLFEAQEIPRIGQNLFRTGKIDDDKFSASGKIFREYVSISKNYGSGKIFAFGTSALRTASNSKEFIDFIYRETGVQIRVISGNDEAYYGYRGALFDLPESRYCVLDIGGGSTEFSYMNKSKFINTSFEIGSVRLRENFLSGNDIQSGIKRAEEFIVNKLKSFSFYNERVYELAGVAGTMTTLSAIKNKLCRFDENVIHKDKISIDEIGTILDNLSVMQEDKIAALGEYMKGRSDIILSGALILRTVMEHFNFTSVIVSTKGLRYGLLLNIADFF